MGRRDGRRHVEAPDFEDGKWEKLQLYRAGASC